MSDVLRGAGSDCPWRSPGLPPVFCGVRVAHPFLCVVLCFLFCLYSFFVLCPLHCQLLCIVHSCCVPYIVNYSVLSILVLTLILSVTLYCPFLLCPLYCQLLCIVHSCLPFFSNVYLLVFASRPRMILMV